MNATLMNLRTAIERRADDKRHLLPLKFRQMIQPAPLSEPNASSIVAAVQWIQAVLVGGLTTPIAVLAIAGVGFGLLGGRLEPRRALRVVLGCFILFGAPTIVGALKTAISSSVAIAELAPTPVAPVVPAAPAIPNSRKGANPFDPNPMR